MLRITRHAEYKLVVNLLSRKSGNGDQRLSPMDWESEERLLYKDGWHHVICIDESSFLRCFAYRHTYAEENVWCW